MNKQLKFSVLGLFLLVGITANAQVDVSLKLNHTFEGANFQYGSVYDLNGKAVEISRCQYYLSGFELEHDGGQTTTLPDAYVLASANISDYDLGQANVTTLEGISFDLGVDSVRNGMGTSSWPSGHPLSAQTPSMDWAWPDGYFFWTIDGKVDGDDDGIPDLDFQLHGIGQHLLASVNGFSGLNLTGNGITVELYVNVADWLKNIDLRYVGYAHDGLHDNKMVRDNTNPETVFTLDNPLSVGELAEQQSTIYADYTIPYAPTIYYDLVAQEDVTITVIDASGKVVLEAKEQPHQGNFFIRKELPDGIYIINFSNNLKTENLRFVVKN